MHHDLFVNLLDKAKIVGPGNNYSLQIDIKEPMEVRSFLNIEESANSNVNFFFMKHTLEWTFTQFIKIQLRIQPNPNPDPNICSNSLWLQANVAINGTSLTTLKDYCKKMYMNARNYSYVVILELEYLHPIKNAVDPQVVFNMLKSVLLTESLLTVNTKSQMINYLLDTRQKSSLRKNIILKMILSNNSYSSNNLTDEELTFIRLWNWFDKYQKTFSNQHYSFNFLELKRLKIQQSLHDVDLKELCHALKSATKLKVLDLSSNFLNEPTALFDIFESLSHLQILDLSDNFINLTSLASRFKYLTNLRELNVSGNFFTNKVGESQNETFGNQLQNLKKLESLDLSWSTNTNLTTGLRHLKNLIMSYCLRIDTQDLAHSLLSLKKLKLLDISHNLIESFPFVQLVAEALNQIEEVNLSHNLIRMQVSELGIFFASRQTKLRRINFSGNFLCGDDEEFQAFLKEFWMSKLHEVDLSDNNLYFYNEINHTLIISSTPAKTIYVRNSSLIKDHALVKYAGCLCKCHESTGFNCHSVCLIVSNVFQKSKYNDIGTLKAQLNAIRDKIELYKESPTLQQYNLMSLDQSRTLKQWFAMGHMNYIERD